MKAIFSCQICERWRSTGYLSQLRARLRDWALRPVRAGCYPWAALPFIDSKTLYRRLRAWAISALAQATEGYMNPAARLQARGRLLNIRCKIIDLQRGNDQRSCMIFSNPARSSGSTRDSRTIMIGLLLCWYMTWCDGFPMSCFCFTKVHGFVAPDFSKVKSVVCAANQST